MHGGAVIAAAVTWPALPQQSADVVIGAQPWPQKPGPREVRLHVVYPGDKLVNVNDKTGVMLTLHNWGGKDVSVANYYSSRDRQLV